MPSSTAVTTRAADAGATPTIAASATLAAPSIEPRLQPACSEDITGRPIRRSMATPCAFMATSITPLAAPNPSMPMVSSVSDGARTGIEASNGNSSAEAITMRRLDTRVSTWPVTVMETSAPAADASRAMPIWVLVASRLPAIHGMLASQKPTIAPLATKIRNVATRADIPASMGGRASSARPRGFGSTPGTMVTRATSRSGGQPGGQRNGSDATPTGVPTKRERRMTRPAIATRLGALLTATLATAAVLAAGAAPAAAAGPAPLIDGWRPAPAPVTVESHTLFSATRAGQRTATVTPAGGDPCTDRARSFTGGHWTDTYRWSFRASSTPSGITRGATERALKRAIANMTGAHNDCGRRDRVSATAIYQGRTDRRPAPTEEGGCGPRDDVNVVGFGELPDGIAGLTCVWSIGDRIIEADIKLDKRAKWATSLAGCAFESMVEAVATHEFGHVFGLGHVKEATHGRLTMSERLDGYCQMNEATLGAGDLLGLEELY